MIRAPFRPESAASLQVSIRARPIRSIEQHPFLRNSEVELIPHWEATVRGQLPQHSSSAPDQRFWEIGFEAAPAAALLAAIKVQQATRPLTRDRTNAHAVVVIGAPGEPLETLLEATSGGQIICSATAHTALASLPDAPYYDWNERSDGSWECVYDSALRLLDPPLERMFAAEIEHWVRPLRAAMASSSQREPRGEIASPYSPDIGNDLFGLALSGGGMRSATYSLGVLQALARHGLLADVDYLSSVSGGGYVATSLAGMSAERLHYRGLKRLGSDYEHFPFAYPTNLLSGTPRPRSLAEAEARARELPVHGNESPALWHVRKYANLLGNGIGLFDLTTWLSVGRYLASTLSLWLLFLLPPLAVLSITLVPGWTFLWGAADSFRSAIVIGTVGAIALLLIALGMITVAGARPPDHAMAKRALRAAVSVAALSLLALVIAGSAWFIDHGADWAREFATAGTVSGALVAFVGSRLLAAQNRWLALAARLLVQVGGFFILGGLLMWATYLAAYFWGATEGAGPTTWARVVAGIVLLCLVTASTLVSLLSFRGGRSRGLLNRLSLQDLYEARIQQTWIVSGHDTDDAGNPRRHSRQAFPRSAPRWTRVWPSRLTMRDLLRNAPRTPYPLICCALSIAGSRGDKLPERKADSFVIAPLFSGSALTRWRVTSELSEFTEMPLARAAAISGAVVSPNMGEHTSTSLSVILTLLNVRIGRWVANPRQDSSSIFGRFAPLLYFREMLGQANRQDASVYLSDGGHFENLGVYELFRRRCRYIIAVSADIEAASGDKMGNLGNALRAARVDFGVEVALGPLQPLLRDRTTGRPLAQFAVGRIHYPRVPSGPSPDAGLGDRMQRETVASGHLIFIKCGLVDAEISPDLLQYLSRNASFPYDPSTDQQFDQPQFESYRQLGFLAVDTMFRQHPDAADQGKSLHDRFLELSEPPAVSASDGRGGTASS